VPVDLAQLHKRVRRVLDEVLTPEETVVALVRGKSRQVLVVTDARLVVVKPGMMAGAGLAAKWGSFPFDQIAAVNVYNGPGVSAIELLPRGQQPGRADLRAAYHEPNWLPCDKTVAASPLIGELRTFVLSGGRSRSARAALDCS
jgi:hypothetical protein